MEYERNLNLWQNCIVFLYLIFSLNFLGIFLHFFWFWNIMLYNYFIWNKIMNKFARKLSNKVKRFRRNYNSNWNIFVVCIAIVMIWKWIWDLLEIYIFPGYPLLSNFVCIVVWILVLLVDDGKLWELQEEDPHKDKNLK